MNARLTGAVRGPPPRPRAREHVSWHVLAYCNTVLRSTQPYAYRHCPCVPDRLPPPPGLDEGSGTAPCTATVDVLHVAHKHYYSCTGQCFHWSAPLLSAAAVLQPPRRAASERKVSDHDRVAIWPGRHQKPRQGRRVEPVGFGALGRDPALFFGACSTRRVARPQWISGAISTGGALGMCAWHVWLCSVPAMQQWLGVVTPTPRLQPRQRAPLPPASPSLASRRQPLQAPLLQPRQSASLPPASPSPPSRLPPSQPPSFESPSVSRFSAFASTEAPRRSALQRPHGRARRQRAGV